MAWEGVSGAPRVERDATDVSTRTDHARFGGSEDSVSSSDERVAAFNVLESGKHA